MTKPQRALIGLLAMLALGLLMWGCIVSAFAQTRVCNVSLMVRPIGETRALCELAGARPGAEACTIIGPPPTIIMSDRESARASLYTFGFWWDHELQHACGGLPAE